MAGCQGVTRSASASACREGVTRGGEVTRGVEVTRGGEVTHGGEVTRVCLPIPSNETCVAFISTFSWSTLSTCHVAR